MTRRFHRPIGEVRHHRRIPKAGVGALNDGDDRSRSVLVEFAAEVDSRARALRRASIALTTAVGLDALAAIMIAYTATQ